jgi:hypothetical protein
MVPIGASQGVLVSTQVVMSAPMVGELIVCDDHERFWLELGWAIDDRARNIRERQVIHQADRRFDSFPSPPTRSFAALFFAKCCGTP